MKTIRLYLTCTATAIALLAGAQRVPAQFTGPYTDSMGGGFNNPISAQMSTMLWNRIFYPKASGTSGRGTAPPSAAARASQPEPNRPAGDSAMRFRPTGTYIKTREMADHLGNTPAERAQYLTLMNAVLDGFGQRVKQAGLQNDLPIALSCFLAENVRIYRGMPE